MSTHKVSLETTFADIGGPYPLIPERPKSVAITLTLKHRRNAVNRQEHWRANTSSVSLTLRHGNPKLHINIAPRLHSFLNFEMQPSSKKVCQSFLIAPRAFNTCYFLTSVQHCMPRF